MFPDVGPVETNQKSMVGWGEVGVVVVVEGVRCTPKCESEEGRGGLVTAAVGARGVVDPVEDDE